MRKLSIPALAVSWLLILSPAAHAFDIIQITNNSTNDYSPGISGSNAVWANEADGDFEVYLWDGATITQITNNSTLDVDPAISGSNVVWLGCEGGTGISCDGGDSEIYLWGGATTTQNTDNATSEGPAVISGSKVV